MKGKNIVIIILVVLVLGLSLYIVYDKTLSKENKDNDIDKGFDNGNTVSIKNNEELDYVYDADYTYDNKYQTYEINNDGYQELVEIDKYYNNFKVEYRKGEQRVSDLKVPYINIKSSYGDSVNKELKKLYEDKALEFDENAKESEEGQQCRQVLTYRTYNYNDMLSVVVIYATQCTAPWNLNYKTYNFDLSTGNEISYKDMVLRLGYAQDTMLEKVDKALKLKMDELFKEDDLDKGCNNGSSCYEIAYSKLNNSISDNSVLFFTNNSGVLTIMAVPYNDGVQNGEEHLAMIEVTK